MIARRLDSRSAVPDFFSMNMPFHLFTEQCWERRRKREGVEGSIRVACLRTGDVVMSPTHTVRILLE